MTVKDVTAVLEWNINADTYHTTAGDFHTSHSGNNYMLVAVNYFTKFVTIMAISGHTAPTLGKHLVNEVFSRIGFPG